MPLDVTARKFAAEQALEEGCTGLVLAVSGGADSMAMLHWYTERPLPFPITVAHVHHGLRRASDGEEAMVLAFCQSRKIPCHVLHTDVKKELQKGETVESAARRLRYRFFDEVAAICACTALGVGIQTASLAGLAQQALQISLLQTDG